MATFVAFRDGAGHIRTRAATELSQRALGKLDIEGAKDWFLEEFRAGCEFLPCLRLRAGGESTHYQPANAEELFCEEPNTQQCFQPEERSHEFICSNKAR